MRPNTASIAAMVSAAVFPGGRARGAHPLLTLMQDEHRAGAFADDEVALPMASLAAAFNDLGTIMDRRSILDGVARGAGGTRTTAFVATRQITPQRLGLLCGPIDEGVDCLAADGPQPRFVPGFQPAGDLLGRPSLGEPITHEQTQSGLSFEDRFTPPAQLIGSGGV